MDFARQPESSSFTLALYGTAIVVAVGAAAFAATAAFAPGPTGEMLTVASGAPRPAAVARIAGLIEPAMPMPAAAAKWVAPTAPPARPAAAGVAAAVQRPAPPKPMPRPCLECTAHVATAPAAMPQDAAPAIASDQAVDMAAAAARGPVPPMPVGPAPERGASQGPVMRAGRAVVDGGAQLVDSALTLSGQAFGGLVRGMRDRTF